jgi:hypothetical protein
MLLDNNTTENQEDDKKEEKEEKEEKETDNINRLQEHTFDNIWEIRREMIQYCEEACIPLCDYLNIDILEQFIANL